MTWVQRALFAVGLVVVGFGVAGLIVNADVTKPGEWATYLFGGLVLHDAVWAPIVVMGSFLIVALSPPWLTRALQVTLFVSASTALVAAPALTGFGRLANNPSILPNDYWGNLALVLAVVWLAGLAGAIRARRRGSA